MKPSECALALDTLAKGINQWANRKGFWSFPDPIPLESSLIKSTKLMLVVTELAEAVEGFRKPIPSTIPPYTNEEEEIADAIIRLLDYAGQYKLRIGEAVIEKIALNEGRPFRHDKNF